VSTNNGHANIVPADPGNLRALKHGAWSDRALAPCIEEYRERLLALPHVAPVDAAAFRRKGLSEWTARRQSLE
jgi:hypothetical protein